MLKENYKIKGHIKIYDENHNLLQEVDNMIVNGGRKYILQSTFGEKPDGTIGMFISQNKELSTAAFTWTKPEEVNPPEGSDIISAITILDIHVDDFYVTLKSEFTHESAFPINSIGLFYETTLFSRAVIEPFILSYNKKIIIEYSIHF